MVHLVEDSSAAFQTIDYAILSVLIIVLIVLGLRGRKIRKKIQPPKGQRVRLIAEELLEPILELVIVGVLVWRDLSMDGWHLAAGLIALIPGAALGRYRTQNYYVSALPEYKSVIVRYSKIGVIILIALIFVKVISSELESVALPYWATLVLTALLVLFLAESFVRVGTMYKWYRRDVEAQQNTPE